MGGWYRSIAFSPVVLKLKEMSPFLHPGTSMYDWLDVNVTTYFCVSENMCSGCSKTLSNICSKYNTDQEFSKQTVENIRIQELIKPENGTHL
jgi:hypothetical protein